VYADADVRCVRPVSAWASEFQYDAELLVGVAYVHKRTGIVTRIQNFVIVSVSTSFALFAIVGGALITIKWCARHFK
jgi:hypothetical protein